MSLPPPSAPSLPATVLRAGGLTLALYLGTLPLLQLPCLGGQCAGVLGSSYGKFFGLPVGLIGALFWLLTLLPTRRIAGPAHHGLALGSVGFVALQAFVLRQFCPWCLAHALLCWAAWPWRHRPAVRPGRFVFATVVLAAAGVLIHRQLHRPASLTPVSTLVAALRAEGFAWFGPMDDATPVLVLSPSCPTCLDALERIAASGWPSTTPRPVIVWRTDDTNRRAVAIFAAVVEANPAPESATFRALLPTLLTERDLLLNNPAGAATVLALTWNPTPTTIATMERRLAGQQAALDAAHVVGTPTWIAIDGTMTHTLPGF